MVNGLNIFKDYFKDYSDNYIIIGGTACDMIIDAAGFTPRTTKDIDIILVIEALSSEFVKKFWEFIKAGDYERKEQSEEQRKYYRFCKPANKEFPFQLELFSRQPDVLNIQEGAQLTPIPFDDDLSSLSAILMSEDYYDFTISHCQKEQGLHRANTETLMCLKAKAYLDLKERKAKGENIDEKNIRKHKTDIFRLSALLPTEDIVELPALIKNDMQVFVDAIATELPDKIIFKEMQMPGVDVSKLFENLKSIFQLNK